MTYLELKNAILADTQRSDFSSVIARFIQQAEALISASLEGYFLEGTIVEVNRVTGAIYNLPAKTTSVRHIIYNNNPLTQVDETLIAQYRDLTEVGAYCMRDSRVVFAGVPPTNASFNINYFGMPAALAADGDTNNLLNDYPQLYNEAAQVYVFKRARNLEMSSAMFQSVQTLIKEINRKTKKKLSGAQAANAYNVSFRSSY